MSIFSKMKGLGPVLLMCVPGVAWAERVECTFTPPCLGSICYADEIPVAFTIDHNQFAPALDPKEPPRNKVTTVALGEERFQAEPIVMDDGTRGFWANIAGVDHLMTMRPDGMGTYATTGAIPFMSGHCGVTP